VVGEADAFTISRDGAAVLEGKLSAPERDENSGDLVRTADFSSLAAPGRYELHVGGAPPPSAALRTDEGAGAPLNIAANPYQSVLQLALRAYRGQRCGTAVDIGGGYAHPACHLDSEHPGG